MMISNLLKSVKHSCLDIKKYAIINNSKEVGLNVWKNTLYR